MGWLDTVTTQPLPNFRGNEEHRKKRRAHAIRQRKKNVARERFKRDPEAVSREAEELKNEIARRIAAGEITRCPPPSEDRRGR